MTREELYKKIQQWESDNGESFVDYFAHDSVKPVSWAFWCIGRGYVEHGNIIANLIESGEDYIEQDVLFDIHPEYINDVYNVENADTNTMILADFLTASEIYQKRVTEFFNEN